MNDLLRTAEYVTPKHPDKLCDRIADSILDECLRQDAYTRSAIEVMGGHGIVTVTGELTTNAYVDIPQIVKGIVGDIGVQVNVVKQSQEIAKGVDGGGAGDQGIMIGYACRENEDLIPQELYLARKLCQKLYQRWPVDGKVQVTLQNNEIYAIVASFQGVSNADLSDEVAKWASDWPISDDLEVYINSAGEWATGGFQADTGVTGRKIVMDAYGPRIPVGGGAFSGKDGTKVDRSGAYMARKVAVDILKADLDVNFVLVKVAYVIGKAEPIQVDVVVDGILEPDIAYLKRFYPQVIIEKLGLREPIYAKTAMWGHFGNNFNWD